MSHDVICFTSRYSVGVTFLLWSYHWLCGHDTYYKEGIGSIKVPSNPNTEWNAHNFRKNTARGSKEWQQSIQSYRQLKDHGTISFYGNILYSPGVSLTVDRDYGKAINQTAAAGVPIVLILESESDPYYFSKLRIFDHTAPYLKTSHGVPQYLIDTLNKYFNNQYYQDVISKDNLQIWDLREFMAFNYKHIFLSQSKDYKKYIDFTQPHLCIDSRQIWHDGEYCIRDIMKYLGECIDESRWANWVEVYREWQKIHLDILRFSWNLPHAINAIINGYDYDLTPMNLNLERESIIQGYLIDHYSVNLRAWQLDKFPNNAKGLHDLLEPLNN